MNRPGDWKCRSCQHLNFQRRDSCQRCGDPRPGMEYGGSGGWSGFGFSSGPVVRPGDWYCPCGAHNFASRLSCFKCGTAKGESPSSSARGGGSNRPGWKSGDWICSRPECKEHNFANRTDCFGCGAPRDSGGSSSF